MFSQELKRDVLFKLSELLVPFEKLVALLQRPECELTTDHFVDLLSKIQDGDVLFSETFYELSNGIKIGDKYYLGIPGSWKHVAIYQDGMVYEAVTKGVRRISLPEWFFKKDSVGIARCNQFALTPMHDTVGAEFLQSCLGAEYQFNFASYTKGKYYCSAYWYSYMEAMYGDAFLEWFPMPMMFGVLPIIQPQDVWNKLDKVASYNE